MNELLEKIESYNFKDPLGHELKMCAEWQFVKKIFDFIESIETMEDVKKIINLGYD